MSNTDDIAELVIKASQNAPVAHFTTDDRREFVMTRNDFVLKDISSDEVKAKVVKPSIVAQTVTMQTADSFIEYANRFKNSDSVIFADVEHNIVLSVIDYHRMPGANQEQNSAQRDPGPELGRHQVRFPMPFSLEWQTWMGQNGKLMKHKDFATFLEEQAIDILPLPKVQATTPDEQNAPESLLELTRTLQVTNKVNFESSVRHGSYEKIDFQKQADATAKGSLMLPVSFQIMIPVYFGEPPVELTCFLRKQIDDSELRIGFSIARHENVRQEEFQRVVSVISGSTGLTTLFGKPSA